MFSGRENNIFTNKMGDDTRDFVYLLGGGLCRW